METEDVKVQKAIVTCDEFIEEKDGGPITKRTLIDYDLSPFKKIIECDGIDELIETLRTLHNDIVESSLISFEKGEQGIFENNPDLVQQLFVIRELANIFDEIRSETYQLKDWPIVNIKKTA